MARRSLPHSPDAFILINTWPCPGSGTGNSRISTRSSPGRIAPLMRSPFSPSSWISLATDRSVAPEPGFSRRGRLWAWSVRLREWARLPLLHYRVCDVVGHGEAAVAHARREELRQGADFC